MLELAQVGLNEKKTVKEPIHIYENKEELLRSLEEWKHRLYLDSWIICVGYHDEEDYPGEAGHVEFSVEHQTATVTLLKNWDDNRIIKYSQEETLVHELLHLKIGFVIPSDTIEGNYFDIMQHRLIVEMSHALINAKYNLTREWWRNDERCR